MKTKNIIVLFVLIACYGFVNTKRSPVDKLKKPRIYVDNFATEVQDGTLINCRKIKNMGVVVYLNREMESYDNYQVELHRFGTDGDAMVAYQNFTPSHKEYQKKIAGRDSLKLDLINPTDVSNSDFVTNTLLFKMGTSIENVVCTIHELQHCNFYVVIKGYKKTGKVNQFGEEEFDNGIEISERSIVFRNWEKK